jgi:hypothetical protein
LHTGVVSVYLIPVDETKKPDKPMVPAPLIEEEQFDETGAVPTHWLWSARKLRKAAEMILREFEHLGQLAPPGEPVALVPLIPRKGQMLDGPIEGHELAPIFMMLAGLALENAFKGVCIKKSPQTVKGGRLPTWLTSHNLAQLSGRAQVSMTRAEKELVERLHVHVMWAGRYPVPKDATGWQIHRVASSTLKTAKLAFWLGSDGVIFRRLFDKLAAEIEK